MKQLKRISALALAVLLCAGLLAGCGGASGSGSEPAPDSTGASAGTDAAPADDGAGDGGEEEAIDFSKGLDGKGFLADVTALECVSLPEDYSAIPVPAEAVAVSDEAVQEQIDGLMAQYAEPERITGRAIEDGDMVNIDYSGSIDGEKFSGGTASGQSVLAGSQQFIDDFLTQIIGHSAGETFDVEVTFPDPYKNNPDLAGKDAVFEVTVNYIEGEPIVPECTDDFVRENLQGYYGWESVGDMRAEIREGTRASLLSDYVWNYLTEQTEFREMPQAALDFQGQAMLNQIASQAAMYGVALDDFLQAMGVESAEALLAQSEESLLLGAKQLLIQQAIAEELGITADDGAIRQYFFENMGAEDYSAYEEHFGKPYLCMAVLSEMVYNHVVGNAVVEPE